MKPRTTAIKAVQRVLELSARATTLEAMRKAAVWPGRCGCCSAQCVVETEQLDVSVGFEHEYVPGAKHVRCPNGCEAAARLGGVMRSWVQLGEVCLTHGVRKADR